LREELETLVEGELADPRIGLVSVSSVALADDSRSARVFVTVEGDDAEAARSLEGLNTGCGDTFAGKSPSVCICAVRQNCFFRWTVPACTRPESQNCLGRTKKRKR